MPRPAIVYEPSGRSVPYSLPASIRRVEPFAPATICSMAKISRLLLRAKRTRKVAAPMRAACNSARSVRTVHARTGIERTGKVESGGSLAHVKVLLSCEARRDGDEGPGHFNPCQPFCAQRIPSNGKCIGEDLLPKVCATRRRARCGNVNDINWQKTGFFLHQKASASRH
jgi:hypothetical protein